MSFYESTTARSDFTLEEILAEFRDPGASPPASPPPLQEPVLSEPEDYEETEEELPSDEPDVPEEPPVTCPADVDDSDESREPEEPQDSFESDEPGASEEPEAPDVPDEAADPSRRNRHAPVKPPPQKKGLFYRIKGELFSKLTVRAYERRQQMLEKRELRALEEPAADPSMAAALYSCQYSALFRRTQLAFLVTLLPLWISLGFYTGFPLPAGLREPAAASFVCLCALITVMVIALDVVTQGIMSVFSGTPGSETLTVLSSLIVTVHLLLTAVGSGGDELPPALLPCVAFSLLLLSNTMTCRARRISFRLLSKNRQPYTVTSERLLGREEAFLIKSSREPQAFLRRSEEPDPGETLSMSMFTPLILLSVLLSVVVGLVKGSLNDLIRTLSYLSCVWVGWGSLFSLSFISLTLTRRLKHEGSAVAGWSGIQDGGRAAHLILTDSDLFPAGSCTINGVKILKGFFTDKVISYTASVLLKARTGIAPLFLDLLERNGGEIKEIEDFTVEEGGLSGYIDGEKVMVGCAGFMHLRGIKVPARFLGGSAVFTAINDTLVSRFGIEYRPDASVAEALQSLRNSQRKPIFAVRDFNIDPLLIKEKFHCSSDEFEFPSMPERYEITAIPEEGNSETTGIITAGGLDSLSAISSGCRAANLVGSACRIFSLVSTILGMILVAVSSFASVSFTLTPLTLFLFSLIWVVPLLFFLPELRN